MQRHTFLAADLLLLGARRRSAANPLRKPHLTLDEARAIYEEEHLTRRSFPCVLDMSTAPTWPSSASTSAHLASRRSARCSAVISRASWDILTTGTHRVEQSAPEPE